MSAAQSFVKDIRGAAVRDLDGRRVATVLDLATISTVDFPAVRYAILAMAFDQPPWGKAAYTACVDAKDIVGWDSQRLKLRLPVTHVQPEPMPADAICLGRNLLDRQIVDQSNRKLMRVNDVLLRVVDGTARCLGLVSGLSGLFTRLNPTAAGLFGRGTSDENLNNVILWDLVSAIERPSWRIRLAVDEPILTNLRRL